MIMDGVQDKIVAEISAKTGLSWDMSQKAIKAALPMIMWGLSKNADSEEGKQAIDTALDSHSESDSLDETQGSKILGHIFGSKEQEIERQVATEAWVSEKEASSITKMLASSVMGKLWAEKKAGNDVAWALQKDTLAKSLITGFLDKDGDGDIKDDLMAKWMDFLKKKFM